MSNVSREDVPFTMIQELAAKGAELEKKTKEQEVTIKEMQDLQSGQWDEVKRYEDENEKLKAQLEKVTGAAGFQELEDEIKTLNAENETLGKRMRDAAWSARQERQELKERYADLETKNTQLKQDFLDATENFAQMAANWKKMRHAITQGEKTAERIQQLGVKRKRLNKSSE